VQQELLDALPLVLSSTWAVAGWCRASRDQNLRLAAGEQSERGSGESRTSDSRSDGSVEAPVSKRILSLEASTIRQDIILEAAEDLRGVAFFSTSSTGNMLRRTA